jgi:hypothetical protein
MNNKEFQVKLKNIYADFPYIAKRKQKTLNELVYVLRMTGEDYQLNTTEKNNPGTFGCIPGVQDVFIPVRDLAKKVVSVEFDDETYEEMGIQLLLVELEDDDEWFGKVRWCEEDLEEALKEQGYPVTENNVSKLRSLCEHHFFTDCMIERGWDYIYDQIGEGDGWDE